MPFKIVIEPRALQDIQQTIDYYDEKLIGLGERFHAVVSSCIEAISVNPFYQLRYKDYRALPTERFPFLIIFYIDETSETAHVTAVFHASQNPENLIE